MGFRDAIGPVSVTPTAGMDEDPDGNLRLYTRPTREVRIETGQVVTDSLQTLGATVARGGAYVGGVEPSLGAQLLPVTAGKYVGTTNASGDLLVPHGGSVAPLALTVSVDGLTSAFSGAGFTLNVRAVGATAANVRAYDSTGTALASVVVGVHFVAVHAVPPSV